MNLPINLGKNLKMFELIGIMAVYAFILLILVTQYALMITGVVKQDLNKIGHIIGWIPFLPFILMFIATFWYVFIYVYKNFKKWFELKWCWIFIRPKKRVVWAEYIRKKYEKK